MIIIRSYAKKLENARKIRAFTENLGLNIDSNLHAYITALVLLEHTRIKGGSITKTKAKRLRWIVSKYEKTNSLNQGATP